MKIRFSIRDLFVGVFLVAATISLTTFFHNWRERHVETEFRTFWTLEKLKSLADGDKLSDVQTAFGELIPLDGALAEFVLSRPELTSSDEVYMVPVSDSYARNLHFEDGVLVNYNFTEKDMRDAMNSIQPAVPQWYVQQGDWLIVSIVLAVVVLLRGCLAFVRSRIPSAL